MFPVHHGQGGLLKPDPPGRVPWVTHGPGQDPRGAPQQHCLPGRWDPPDFVPEVFPMCLVYGVQWNMEQSKEAMVGSSEALWESIDVGCEAKGRRMPWAGVCRGRSSPGGGPWAVKPGSTEGAKAKQQNRAYLCLRQSPIRHLS